MRRAATRLVIVLACFLGMALPSSAAKRVALVIGNSAYQHTTALKNPKNDADAVAEKLERLDFNVLKGIDLTHRQFGRTVAKFRRMLAGADVALFFYAGHGMQMHNRNFLVPVDALLEDQDSLDFEAVRLQTVLGLMEREPRTNLIFLDACRDNPLARNLSRSLGTRSALVGRGFAREETGIGTMIAFATQPGNVALDGGQEKHSPFTKALLKHIGTPGQDIANLLRQVRLDVISATSSRQVPWNNSSLTAPFIFRAKAKVEFRSDGAEETLWNSLVASGQREDYERYLQQYPRGQFATLASIRLEEMKYRETLEADRKRREQERAELEQLRKEFAARRAREAEAIAERKRLEDAERKRLDQETRKRLAELRAERERLEAEREALAKKATATDPVRAAGLAPDATSRAITRSEPIQDPKALALALQKELLRVGCNPGRPDGVWGRKGKAALAAFNRFAKTALATAAPSQQALDVVKAQTTRVCSQQNARQHTAKKAKPVAVKRAQTQAPAKRNTKKNNFKSHGLESDVGACYTAFQCGEMR